MVFIPREQNTNVTCINRVESVVISFNSHPHVRSKPDDGRALFLQSGKPVCPVRSAAASFSPACCCCGWNESLTVITGTWTRQPQRWLSALLLSFGNVRTCTKCCSVALPVCSSLCKERPVDAHKCLVRGKVSLSCVRFSLVCFHSVSRYFSSYCKDGQETV